MDYCCRGQWSHENPLRSKRTLRRNARKEEEDSSNRLENKVSEDPNGQDSGDEAMMMTIMRLLLK